MSLSIAQKIVHHLSPLAQDRIVASVHIGLAYTSVRLDNGNTGVAWTARLPKGCCCHLADTGKLTGKPARELLDFLLGQGGVAGSIGLATANALNAAVPTPEAITTDILDQLDIRPEEHVAMVGYFGPFVPRLKRIGCRLDIIELDQGRPEAITPEAGKAALAGCQVALITATSIITRTIDTLLAGLGPVRAAVMVGPSTPICPEVFRETPITHIAGIRVRDAGAVERIVSEAGGTKHLKPHMDFITLRLR